MKPHIKLAPPGGRFDEDLGRWWCRSEGLVYRGRGRTPFEAYENWWADRELAQISEPRQRTPRGYA